MDNHRILILWNDSMEQIVEILVVPTHETASEWFAWIDSARAAAEAAGFRLYNWGNVEPIHRDKAMKNILDYSVNKTLDDDHPTDSNCLCRGHDHFDPEGHGRCFIQLLPDGGCCGCDCPPPAPVKKPPREQLFHDIIPEPKCCGHRMEREGNLSLHCLGYKCPDCFKYLQIAVTFTEGQPNVTQATLNAIDTTP